MKKLLQNKNVGLMLFLLVAVVVNAQEADTLAPEIVAGPDVEGITSTSAVISWKTNEPSTGIVYYGKGNDLNKSVSSTELQEEHAVELINLEAATSYNFQLSATDSLENGPFLTEIDTFVTEEAEIEEPENTLPAIEIVGGEVEIIVGDTVQFQIVYIDTNEVEIDTVAQWSVIPDSLGSINENGVFIATGPGECVVNAELDTLSDWVLVKIDPEEDNEDPFGEEYEHLVILPRDTVITIGAQIQFEVYYQNDSGGVGTQVDSILEWSLQGMPVGEMSDAGLFTAVDLGFSLITAKLGDREGTSFVVVSDSTFDTTGINTITITRSSPNPQGFSVMKILSEGQLWTISGLPHPMNILNGGGVYFPIGSLVEDIRIHIALPGFAEAGPDGVNFGPNGVVGGVDFEVMVNDTIVEPYYFETPLIVGLVYKRGLLNNLGIDPLSLSLYFATMENDSIVFDTSGIAYTTLDLTQNKILSSVAHFTSLVVKGETGAAVNTEKEKRIVPTGYVLRQNYPNPFNPTTVISYGIPTQTDVKIIIYDLLGNEVKTLIDLEQSSG
ncbi:fibronectin type III domain-containing protein, partial [bacterium]|nr:fibronectin type III domain-containing protein [bacterium]